MFLLLPPKNKLYSNIIQPPPTFAIIINTRAFAHFYCSHSTIYYIYVLNFQNNTTTLYYYIYVYTICDYFYFILFFVVSIQFYLFSVNVAKKISKKKKSNILWSIFLGFTFHLLGIGNSIVDFLLFFLLYIYISLHQ